MLEFRACDLKSGMSCWILWIKTLIEPSDFESPLNCSKNTQRRMLTELGFKNLDIPQMIVTATVPVSTK